MFRGRMIEHSIEKPIAKDDGLGFSYADYEKPTEAYIYIAKPTASDYNQNEFYTQRYEATAFTFDSLPLGTRIDSKWKVESVDQVKQQFALGLVAIGAANG